MSNTNIRIALNSENIRTKCPGMSEPVYQFAEYVGAHINDNADPMGLALAVTCALDDVKKHRCGFGGPNTDFPDYLAEHELEVQMQAAYILQIIDAVADPDYANEAREVFSLYMGWNPPKRPKVDNIPEPDSEDPANVRAAVNWWRNTLVNPKMDNGDSTMGLFMSLFGSGLTGGNTESAITAFCDALSILLCDKVYDEGGDYYISLDVDYGPGGLLAEAVDRARGAKNLQFPCKTHMIIKPDEVTVSYGYCQPYETIWKAA